MKLGALLAASGAVVAVFFGIACGSSDPATNGGSTSDGGSSDGSSATDGASGADGGGKDAGSDAQVADDDGGLFVITGGTFNALTLNPVDGTAFITNGATSELIVLIADKPSLCTTGVSRQNEISFSIDAQSGTSPFPPGTYTQMGMDGPGQVDPAMSQIGPTCLAIGQDYGAANGSTVIVKNVTSTYVSGSFDLTFENDAGTLQGTFHVPICTQAPNTTCQP